jgi:DnaJ-class molecular chaperone
MTKCSNCNGTGKANAVWYGQPTGKKAKCQVCNGTGKSNAIDIFKL